MDVANSKFNPVSGSPVAKTALTDAQLVGSAILGWAKGGRTLIVSSSRGASWKAIRLPSKTTRIRGVAFAGKQSGWKESPATGRAAASAIAFGSSGSGYLNVSRFGDSSGGYVLRTSDGGATWRPQSISPNAVVGGGLVAPDATHAFGLSRAAAVGGSSSSRAPAATRGRRRR